MIAPLPSRAARWRRLSSAEQHITLTAAAAVPAIAIALRVLGYAPIARWVSRRSKALHSDHVAVVRTATRAVGRVRRYGPYRGNCLSTSLALQWLLRRRGVATSLRIGARFENGALRAHAWVEWDGVVVNDTADVAERYAPLGDQQKLPPLA